MTFTLISAEAHDTIKISNGRENDFADHNSAFERGAANEEKESPPRIRELHQVRRSDELLPRRFLSFFPACVCGLCLCQVMQLASGHAAQARQDSIPAVSINATSDWI